MMEWLSGWLREIILMILIAAFIDLILPNGKTQRYVRVVVSLFILLALLTPVVNLLRLNIDPERLIAASLASPEDDGELERILKDGEALRAGIDEQAVALFRREAGELMKRQLEENFPVAVAKIDVKVDEDDNRIERIDLLIDQDAQEPETAGRAKFGMTPVQPVTIEIRVGQDSSEPADAPAPGPAQRELASSISRWLQQEWGVNASDVRIAFTAEPGERG
jgi:stage III sporulation protein AF